MSRKKKEDIVVRNIVAQSTGTVKAQDPNVTVSGPGTAKGQQNPPTTKEPFNLGTVKIDPPTKVPFNIDLSTGTAKAQDPTFTVEPGAGANTAKNQQNVTPSTKKPP